MRAIAGAALIALTALAGPGAPAHAAMPASPLTAAFSPAAADELFGISCVSPRACVAVGLNQNALSRRGGPLAEKWNGKAWKYVAMRLPAGAISGELFGVSCRSAVACVAVGLYLDSSDTGIPLAETWNGRAWRPSRLPAPAGSTGVILDGVSCTSPESCVAVGSGTPGSGRPGRTGFAERWNGSRWTGVSVSWPRGTGNSYLVGVSCAARNCVAVGYSGVSVTAASGTGRATAVSWQGKAWTVTKVPAPGRGKASLFSDVSCLSAANCVAAGQVGPAGSTEGIGLTGFWTGKAWRLVTAL